MGFQEKRQFPRISAKLKVIFRSSSEFSSGYTEDISGGGLFIKTNRLLDPNALINIQMQLPDSDEVYDVIGRVTRLMTLSKPENDNKPLYGVGFRFVEPEADLIEHIQRQLEKQAGKLEDRPSS